MSARAHERLELAGQRRPAAVALARRLSLATRAEPALVRAARLSAGLDATAEADLWFSPLVASAGPLGLALDPGVADLLRGRLEPGERDAAWALVETYHRSEPWSIRLEERINYLTAGGGDPAEIEELIAAALDELHETDERAALGIARWLLAALARLPASARTTSAAAAAEVVAGARVDGRVGDLDALTPEQREAWLPKLLGGIGTVDLPVRLQPGAVVLGGDPAGASLIRVPKTEPIVLTVESERGSEAVRLRAGESRRLAIGTGVGGFDVTVTIGEAAHTAVRGTAVRLRTITGDDIRIVPVAVGRLTYDRDDLAPAIAIAERTVVTVAEDLPPRVLFVPTTAPSAPTGEPRREGEITYLDVFEPFTPAPLTTPAVGDRWRLADGYPGGGTVAVVQPNEILVAVDGETLVERGAALITERPWGAVFGLALGRDARGFLRVAPLTPVIPAQDDVSILRLVDGQLPTVRELQLADAGIQPHPLFGNEPLPRTVDAELVAALNRFEVVAVTGPEGPALASALWTAIGHVQEQTRIAIPRGTRATTAAVLDAVRRRQGADRVIVWLDHPADLVQVLEANPLPPRVVVAAVLGDVAVEHPGIAEVRVEGALDAQEQQLWWSRFGPELAADPADPWSADELAARRRAVARARVDGTVEDRSYALRGLGRALVEAGNRGGEALAALEESVELWAHKAGRAERLLELASEYAYVDRWDRAIEVASEAVALWGELADSPELIEALMTLAQMLAGGGRLDDGVATAGDAVARARSLPYVQPLARALLVLSSLEVQRNDERGIDHAAEAVRIRRGDGGTPLVEALLALGDALNGLGRSEGAVAPVEEALELAQALGDEALVTHAAHSLERARLASTPDSLGAAPAAPPRQWNGGLVALFSDHLSIAGRIVPRGDIASVQVTHGSWRRLPRASIELHDGERIEIDIKAASTLNFVANNRAADDFLQAVTAR